jgi:hypothetical protein
MKTLTSGLVGLAAVLAVVGLAASPAGADHWRWSVRYTAPAASYAPQPLPWRTAPVPVSPVRRAYRAGYRDGYAVGFRNGIRRPVMVRRPVVTYRPVYAGSVVRYQSVRTRIGPAVSGSFVYIRW